MRDKELEPIVRCIGSDALACSITKWDLGGNFFKTERWNWEEIQNLASDCRDLSAQLILFLGQNLWVFPPPHWVQSTKRHKTSLPSPITVETNNVCSLDESSHGIDPLCAIENVRKGVFGAGIRFGGIYGRDVTILIRSAMLKGRGWGWVRNTMIGSYHDLGREKREWIRCVRDRDQFPRDFTRRKQERQRIMKDERFERIQQGTWFRIRMSSAERAAPC